VTAPDRTPGRQPPAPTPPWGPQLTPHGAPPPPPRPAPARKPWPFVAAIAVLAITTVVASVAAERTDHDLHTARRQRAETQKTTAATYQAEIATLQKALATARAQMSFTQLEFATTVQDRNEAYAVVAACAAGVTLALTEHNAGNDPAADATLIGVGPVCTKADEAAKG